MGIFDTVQVELTCPICETIGTRGIQFKHPASLMEIYEVGDLVIGAPAGQPLLDAGYRCQGPDDDDGGHRVDVWIHFDRGFLTAVTHQKPHRPAEVAWWMIERAGSQAARQRRSLRAIETTVRKRRKTLEDDPVPEEGDPPAPLLAVWRIESEEEMLKRLEEILERDEERDWPGPSG